MLRLRDMEIQTPAICAPIIGKDLNKMQEGVEKATDKGARLVELRLDKLNQLSNWTDLLHEKVATIVTNRAKREGGYFEGKENRKIESLLEAIEAGASCIDIELSTSEENRNQAVGKADEEDASVIFSFHNFEKVPSIETMMNKTEKMIEAGCDLAKIIGFANEHEDSLRMLEFLIKSSEKFDIPIIAFAMGEKGKFTRITAPILGSSITYASIEEKTAPGQIDFSTVKEILEKYKN